MVLDAQLLPSAELPPLARVGFRWPLAPSFNDMIWAGLGPHENYPVRSSWCAGL